MTTVLQQAILNELRDAAGRVSDSWDMPPVLVSLRIKGDGLEITPWPVPDRLWDGTHPPSVLAAIGRSLAKSDTDWQEPARDVCAIGFCTEGWTLPAHLFDDDHRAGLTGSLSEHPDRIEVRIMSAVGRDGTSFFLQWTRGEGVTNEAIIEPGDERQLGGLVFHALDLIAEQIFGLTPPRRRMSPDDGYGTADGK
jgi:hypothetical protein